ncbi:DUF7507 domain-containing protein [Algoriphagus sp. PAP.12]|uniref:DUF7507 domain-containing protein n=1 Tax=Algoriphagus sp. PAP.12 TaxID=2996678 RepID=UPI00227B4C3C|nr:hypothetical protein [Algoriphagus sp. PAP.12]
MNFKKLSFLFIFSCLTFFFFSKELSAQNDYRVPFNHRIGNSNLSNNIFQIRGDFTIIGNTNLTLKNYDEGTANSGQEMVFIDIDGDSSTFNSSSATLLFSEENGADSNCTDILYAGLYWSGRTQREGLTFELTKQEGFLDPVTLVDHKDEMKGGEEKEYIHYTFFTGIMTDDTSQFLPQFEVYTQEGEYESYIFQFRNDSTVLFTDTGSDLKPVENLKITKKDGYIQATFTPIEFSRNGINYSIYGLNRVFSDDYTEFVQGNNAVLIKSSGTYSPLAYQTQMFDKRVLKIKAPGSSEYQEVSVSGNAILFPDQELRDIYVGYADVTDLVKEYGAGEYTVADIALSEGLSDEIGMFGNWGLIVVYQNAKMNFRDVTIFDGYTFIEALNGVEENGEIEINGFGAIEEGPVSMKLGVMASEGDNFIGGDYLEMLDQKGNWTRLSHPGNSTDNFFNSSIYTPVFKADGSLQENSRTPFLKNNTGIDIVQWEVPNPDNSLITNKQTSAKFRYGTNQDLYALYAFAFSVVSYTPNIEAHNQIESINGLPPGDSPTIKPGEEIRLQLDIRNVGSEATEQSKLIIPIPFNAIYVDAEVIPDTYGTVTFDPNMGVAGSIIWDIGNIPISVDINEIIASLQYTLKFTEDCFVLANDNCDSKLSVNGYLSGIGSLSKQPFSNLPFIKEYKEGVCENIPTYGPVEIPLIGKAEFAENHCSGFALFTDLEVDNIPIFCHRDSPTNLADLISPSQEGFQVYFFSEESGGTPLINYYVNTSLVGTEKIWVSEGPQGSCTGMRIPVDLKVIPTSPQPITENLNFCMEEKKIPFEVNPDPGYTLYYYEDNDPSSSALTGPPNLDLSKPSRYSLWVSQSKPGECESPRQEVEIYIEDCSLRPEIELTISSDVEKFEKQGQEITFTITVKNPGKVPLFNVTVNEYLNYGGWQIAELGPQEEQSFEVLYTISEWDMIYPYVLQISAHAEGADWQGIFVSDDASKEISGVNFVPGFLDYTIETLDVECQLEEGGKGQIIINWPQGQEGDYFLTDLESGEIIKSFTFTLNSQIVIEVAPGSYGLEILDSQRNSHQVNQPIIILEKDKVEFEVPESINSCTEFIWFPLNDPEINITVESPEGKEVTVNSDGSYTLVHSGIYQVTGTTQNPDFCPNIKSFEAEITQPSELEIDLRPFCKDDSSTSIDLITSSDGLIIQWFLLSSGNREELTMFENSSQLIVQDEGTYEVTLKDPSGCWIGKKEVKVRQSFTDEIVIEQFYSFCAEKNDFPEISPGNRFKEFIWLLDGQIISEEAVFIPKTSGKYYLEAKDELGCSFFAEFEVEEKCLPEVKFPNAIWIGDPSRQFEIYPDYLTDEIEVSIFNRWGQLIYHCIDKGPEENIKSTCTWDGIFEGAAIPNGSYAVNIKVSNFKLNVTQNIRSSIMVFN